MKKSISSNITAENETSGGEIHVEKEKFDEPCVKSQFIGTKHQNSALECKMQRLFERKALAALLEVPRYTR